MLVYLHSESHDHKFDCMPKLWCAVRCAIMPNTQLCCSAQIKNEGENVYWPFDLFAKSNYDHWHAAWYLAIDSSKKFFVQKLYMYVPGILAGSSYIRSNENKNWKPSVSTGIKISDCSKSSENPVIIALKRRIAEQTMSC